MKVDVVKSSIKLAPEGMQGAIIAQIIDLGTQENKFDPNKGKERRVWVSYELPDCKFETEDGEEVTHLIGKEYSAKLSGKSYLRLAIEAGLGKKLEDGKPFDLEKAIGLKVNVDVVHKKNAKGEDKARVEDVKALVKGQKVSRGMRDQFVFSLDNIDDKMLASLPEFLQDIIMKSDEYEAYTDGGYEKKVKGKKAPAKKAAPARGNKR